MMDFSIKRNDGQPFSLHSEKRGDVFKPAGSSEIGGGYYSVKTPNGDIHVNPDGAGFRIHFENYTGSTEEAEALVHSMASRLHGATGEAGEVIRH